MPQAAQPLCARRAIGGRVMVRTGTERIRPEDTFDADYGNLLEKAYGKGMVRPARLERATSWFVAANVSSTTREFIGRIALCHARLPRGN